MRKFLLSALMALSCSFAATAQQFHWGKQAVSNVALAADRVGNVYTVGYVLGSGTPVDVDPGPAVVNVPTSPSGVGVPYVLKYNAQGNIMWAREFNGLAYSAQWAIAVDDSQNVYVTGTADGSLFDPITISYVTRINSNGTQGWHIPLGNGSMMEYTRGRDIAVDSMGYVYVTGFTNTTIDIDPGPNVVSATGKFVVKYTNTGQFVWTTQTGSHLIEAERQGNAVYVVGPAGTIYDHPTRISKLDGSTGVQVWSRNMDSITFTKLDVSEPGKIYATGYFTDTTDFDPNAGVSELMTAGSTDQFLLKLDTSSTFNWVKQMGSSSKDRGTGVVLDGEGNIYTCGVFSGTVDMDPNAGVENLVSMTPDTTDIFVQKLDAAGNYVWAVPIATNWINESFGMAINPAGSFFIIGQANGADVNPGTLVVPINSYQFITKWSDTTVVVSVGSMANDEHNFLVYPNPSAKTINVSAGQVIDNITITDIAGRVVYVATPVSKKFSVEILQPGMYFVNVTCGDKVSARKVLIQ